MTEVVEARVLENIGAEELDLSGMGIESIEPILPLFSRMKKLRSLWLANNNITRLPHDMGPLTSLHALDLSGNPFADLQAVLPGLAGLQQLRYLRIDLPSLADEEELIVAIPSLQTLNDTTLAEDEASAEEVPGSQSLFHLNDAAGPSTSDAAAALTVAWTDGDTRALRGLYRACVPQEHGLSEEAAAEFDEYLARVTNHVMNLTAAEPDKATCEGEVLKAKQLLYEYCFEEASRCIALESGAYGPRVQALLRYQTTLLGAYDAHWRRMRRDRDDCVMAMKQDMTAAAQELEAYLTSATASVSGAGNGASVTLSAQLAGQHRLPPQQQQHQQDRQRQSRKYSGSVGESPPYTRGDTSTPSALPRASYVSANAARPTRLRVSQGRSTSSSQRETKVLTLKQLKHLIGEVYASKGRYDIKCSENQLPRETMEQHMYTFLNQRYGLRELILEYATAIVEGVRTFAAEDNDVAVFGFILRNDIDEEFRHVQQKVRDTVRELLRIDIRNRRPRRSDTEIDRILERKMTGTLSEDEWSEIVKYMYNGEDAAAITDIAQRTVYQQHLASRRRGGAGAVASPKASQWQLAYTDLVNILLNFQLDGHRRFLAPYVVIFRRYDTDHVGIVKGSDFKAIVRTLDPNKGESEITAMLGLVDSLGGQLITFSESVACLSDLILNLGAVSAA